MEKEEMYFEDELNHTGTPHSGMTPHSGRYKYGTGENPFQHVDTFLGMYYQWKRENPGLSDTEYCKARNMSTDEFRMRRRIENQKSRAWDIAAIRQLRRQGLTTQNIADDLGLSEATVRNYLKSDAKAKNNKNSELVNRLEKEVLEKKCVDVGIGVHRELNVSEQALKTAVKELTDKGYVSGNLYVEQLTNKGNKTTVSYLGVPGTEKKDLYNNLDKVKSIELYSPDRGDTFWVPENPVSMSSKRIMVRYAEDGGLERDGTIEFRRGVEDINLGQKSYAQVRIAVDDSHYMKGMAIYGDDKDFPKGIDVIFNTNKKRGTPMMTDDPVGKQVFKTLKDDPENPFGATIKAQGQMHYETKTGEKKLSPVNIIREEGDWNEYSRTLASQCLSKQSKGLIKQQLQNTIDNTKAEYNKIMKLTNPIVKQKLLETFASQCDRSAKDLKVAALPRQATKVILPITSLKDDEIYAPTLNNGEQVVLIRYPHAGTFEIPKLTVNNKNKDGERIIGKHGIDAVGISAAAASQLSGADFDGDTVMVIPVGKHLDITTRPYLTQLTTFEPKEKYGSYAETVEVVNKKTGTKDTEIRYYNANTGKEFSPLKKVNVGMEMGKVSNLITDMNLRGASDEHLAMAVKHSMVVIDAYKHGLDYKQSEKDNHIEMLKKIYQPKADGKFGGASTLISRAKSTETIPERVMGKEYIDPETGEKKVKKMYTADPETGKYTYVDTGREYYKYKAVQPDGKSKEVSVFEDKETGKYYYNQKNADNTKTKVYVPTSEVKVKKAIERVDAMDYYEDAHSLSSGHEKEELYANYANALKSMANSARKEALAIKTTKVSATAAKTYASEVASLNNKLNVALKNAPKERQAQLIGNQVAKTKIESDPSLDDEHIKRIKNQELQRARQKVGANKKYVQVTITDKEWEAIQSNAISTSKLKEILNNTDLDRVRELSMPRQTTKVTSGVKARILARVKQGYTIGEIASDLGLSASTVSNVINE